MQKWVMLPENSLCIHWREKGQCYRDKSHRGQETGGNLYKILWLWPSWKRVIGLISILKGVELAYGFDAKPELPDMRCNGSNGTHYYVIAKAFFGKSIILRPFSCLISGTIAPILLPRLNTICSEQFNQNDTNTLESSRVTANSPFNVCT